MKRNLRRPVSALFILIMALSANASAPIHLDQDAERWAETTLRQMTMEEKVGQMIMVWARIQFMNVNSPEYLLLREEMRQYHVGGFGVTIATDGPLLLKNEPLEAAFLTNELQRDSKYPLIFGADLERGFAMRLNGSTPFPAAMAFGGAADKSLVRQFGVISAQEARAIGIHWNWFPVADVNSNPANPIINTRSFGEDPAQVGQMVAAYIEGARSQGLLTTVKHFPGHGDTDTDSHLSLARVNASLDRLNSVELVPFRSAIAAGVDSVMIGHITVLAIEPDPNRPASISTRVVTGLLKDQLGFHGIVVTDALDMGALMHVFKGTDAEISGIEAVQAIQAGNDMIIIPADLGGAYNGLLNAVKHGSLSEQRIDESVLKILRMKASVGLNRNRFVDVASVPNEIGKPENIAFAQQVSDRAVTLVTDTNHLLPLLNTDHSTDNSHTVAIVFTDDARHSEGGKAFVRQLHQRLPAATVFFVDEANSATIAPDVIAAVDKASTVIAVAEAMPSARRVAGGRDAGKGSAGLDESGAQLLADIVKTAGPRTIFTAFGNPYTGANLAGISTYICTYSNSAASATSLIGALFGEIAVHGHLPVTIPGIAQRGAGLDRNPTSTTAHVQSAAVMH